MRVLKVAALQGAVIAAAAFGCTWLFRLGYFLPIVWGVGALAATFVALTTHREAAQSPMKILVAVSSYVLLTVVLYRGLTDQVSNRTFNMTWRAIGSANQAGEDQVRLEFSEYPGNFVDVYGSDLREYLTRRSADSVPVEFRVTSDLWCVRGFNVVHIDEQSSHDVYWISGGSGSSTNGSAWPWGRVHWWCGF